MVILTPKNHFCKPKNQKNARSTGVLIIFIRALPQHLVCGYRFFFSDIQNDLSKNFYKKFKFLYIKQEFYDISVADDIILAFRPLFSL